MRNIEKVIEIENLRLTLDVEVELDGPEIMVNDFVIEGIAFFGEELRKVDKDFEEAPYELPVEKNMLDNFKEFLYSTLANEILEKIEVRYDEIVGEE